MGKTPFGLSCMAQNGYCCDAASSSPSLIIAYCFPSLRYAVNIELRFKEGMPPQ